MGQQRLFVLFRRIFLILTQKGACSGIQLRTFLFHERCIRVVELQFALRQIGWGYIIGPFHRLMHAEIVSDKSVLVDGKPVTAIEVAGQGGDVIVLARSEAGSIIGSVENQYGGCVFRFSDYGLSLFVPLYRERST